MNLVNSIPKPPPPRDGNKTPLSIVPPLADRICSSIGKITELVPEEKLTGRPKQMKGQETPVIKPVPKQNRAFKANMGLKNQDPFETAFMADTPFPFNADEDLVPKICDEIFRAAPPNGGGGGMGYGHQGYSMKRPNDDVDDGNTFKKKMCETTAFEEIFPEIQEKAVEEFDMSCIDGLLNDPGMYLCELFLIDYKYVNFQRTHWNEMRSPIFVVKSRIKASCDHSSLIDHC